jgi:hypothetical protein
MSFIFKDKKRIRNFKNDKNKKKRYLFRHENQIEYMQLYIVLVTKFATINFLKESTDYKKKKPDFNADIICNQKRKETEKE